MDDRQREAGSIAFDVLGMSRQTLLMKMRFFEQAFLRLPPEVDFETTLSTDGKTLRFNPLHLLGRYIEDEALVPRDYLHCILHCVFQHPYVGKLVNKELWSLACDIAVESIINSLQIDEIRTVRQWQQADILAGLENELGLLSAERVYRWLLQAEFSQNELADLRSRFEADAHPWYPPSGDSNDTASGETSDEDDDVEDTDEEDESAQTVPAEDGEDADESQRNIGDAEQSPESAEGDDSQGAADEGEDQESEQVGRATTPEEDDEGEEAEALSDEDGAGGDDDEEAAVPDDEDGDEDDDEEGVGSGDEEQQNIWKEIAERMEVELQTFSAEHGSNPGMLLQAVAALNREHYDYEEFLRHFSVMGEVMQVNDDEFDYIYYTYGLKLYENMPLIEPLEYKEVKRVREFVVAIDTSASVQGDLVQRFVNKTFNILKQAENYFTEVKLVVIQCDTQITESVTLTNQREVDDYLEHMELKGFGGTDFRPVFKYVDKLVDEHFFTDLRGLIYFTDGYGDFPARMPSYEAAFIFLDDGRSNPKVPSWAMRVLLDEEDL